MTDRPSQWAIEQALRLVAGTASLAGLSTWDGILKAVDNLARHLDKMRAVTDEPSDGLGYGGVVRSHHDDD